MARISFLSMPARILPRPKIKMSSGMRILSESSPLMVRENDYNLNIPRYVDTFEDEEPVDLAAVAGELQKLDKAMQATDGVIGEYCRELGIAAPF